MGLLFADLAVECHEADAVDLLELYAIQIHVLDEFGDLFESSHPKEKVGNVLD